MRKILLLLTALLLITPTVSAQCGACKIVKGATYQNEVAHDIVTPVIAMPVFVPTFSFQYIPPPCPQAAVGAMPAQVGQPAGVNRDELKKLAKELIKEMSAQPEDGEEDDGPPAVPGEDDVGGSAGSNFNLVSILGNRCAACHTGAKSKGGVVIFSSPGILNQLLPKQKIHDAVKVGRMPPRNKLQLSPPELAFVLKQMEN